MSGPVLVTPASRAAGVAARWLEQYPRSEMLGGGETSGKIHRALLALGPTPSPESVDSVIGNTSWTAAPECDGCGDLAPAVVKVGGGTEYEGPAAHLCLPCLRSALATFGGDA